MTTTTCYVFADPDGSRFGVSTNNPPVTGGQVIDAFEDNGGTHEDRLRTAKQRNSPLRLERLERASWQPYPESFPADRDGYVEARVLAGALRGATSEALRLVTRDGVVVPLRPADPLVPFVPDVRRPPEPTPGPALRVDPVSALTCVGCGAVFQPDMHASFTGPNTVRIDGLTLCPCCKGPSEPVIVQGHVVQGELAPGEEAPESGVYLIADDGTRGKEPDADE
jgi:hypothetical protein